MVRYDVSVAGVDLMLDGPYSRRPRLLRGGAELPRDRWGNYQVVDATGQAQQARVDFDFRQLGPVVTVGQSRVLAASRLPLPVRVGLLGLCLLGLSGGAVGAGLSFAAALGVAALLRHPQRRPLHVAAAVTLPVLAALGWLAVATMIHSL